MAWATLTVEQRGLSPLTWRLLSQSQKTNRSRNTEDNKQIQGSIPSLRLQRHSMHAYNKDQTSEWIWASSNLNVELCQCGLPTSERERSDSTRIAALTSQMQWGWEKHKLHTSTSTDTGMQQFVGTTKFPACDIGRCRIWLWIKWYTVKKSTKKLWTKSSELSGA